MIAKTNSADDICEMYAELKLAEQGARTESGDMLLRELTEYLQGGFEARLFIEEQRTIGYCLFSRREGHIYIKHLLVSEENRRMGLGRKYLKQLITEEFGETKLLLDTHPDNLKAFVFWRAFGFEKQSVRLSYLPASGIPASRSKPQPETGNHRFTSDISDLSPSMLAGFFVGWTAPPSKEKHYDILKNSYHFIAAVREGRVIGFINCISDGLHFAFIPMLEVLPEFQGSSLGTSLMSAMLDYLSAIPCIDLSCDENLKAFYRRFNMIEASSMLLRRRF